MSVSGGDDVLNGSDGNDELFGDGFANGGLGFINGGVVLVAERTRELLSQATPVLVERPGVMLKGKTRHVAVYGVANLNQGPTRALGTVAEPGEALL